MCTSLHVVLNSPNSHRLQIEITASHTQCEPFLCFNLQHRLNCTNQLIGVPFFVRVSLQKTGKKVYGSFPNWSTIKSFFWYSFAPWSHKIRFKWKTGWLCICFYFSKLQQWTSKHWQSEKKKALTGRSWKFSFVFLLMNTY